MKVAPMHPREEERLNALRSTGLLDSPPELAYDDIVEIAATLAETPIALVSLVDEDRQWFKARVGLDATQTPRDVAFCAHAILTPDRTLEVADASSDPRFFDNPLVVGGPRVIFYVGVPLRDPATGLPLGTLCVIDHRSREMPRPRRQALEALARQLESMLVLRRQTEDLELARREAERVADDKARFLAVMSHEIRTPLNGVNGFVELLRGGELGEVERHYVDHLATLTRSLRALLDNVLDFSKFEASAVELESVPVALDELIDEVTVLGRPEAESKGLALETTVELACGRFVMSDPTRLRQVLGNLVSNAIKFTDRGHVSIAACGDAQRVVLRVEDTGVGMGPDEREGLFSAFRQANPSTARKYGGTGLGLAISAQIVAAMGGELRVSSTLGRGSTFTIDLPVCYAEVSGMSGVGVVVDESAQSGTSEAPWSGPLMVLVADDDAINRMVAERMLEGLGAEVTTVDDGVHAVARVRAGERYDLVLLDNEMPQLGGQGALVEIRRELGSAAPPCAVVTASALPGDEERLLAKGFDAFVAKPVTVEALRELLDRFGLRQSQAI